MVDLPEELGDADGSNNGNGIVNELSTHSVDDTVERLKAILQSLGRGAIWIG